MGGVAVVVGEEMAAARAGTARPRVKRGRRGGRRRVEWWRRGASVLGSGSASDSSRGVCRASGAGEGGDGGGGEDEVAGGLGKDAVAVDGGDIGVGVGEGDGGVAWVKRVRGVRSRAAAAEQKVRRVEVVWREFGMGGGCDLILRLDLS